MARCKICNPGRTSAHKLTDEQVREMRFMHANGEATYPQLAEKYGVNRDTIWKAITYQRYEWVH